MSGGAHEQNRPPAYSGDQPQITKFRIGSYVPFASCLINGTRDLILVDTGATYSILKNNYKNLCSLQDPVSLALTAANGSPIHVYGHITATIQLGKAKYDYVFYVADVTQNILGVDFFIYYDASIQPARKQLRICDNVIPIDASPYQESTLQKPLAYCPSIVVDEAKIDPYAAQAEVALRRHMWCDISVMNASQQTDLQVMIEHEVQTELLAVDILTTAVKNPPLYEPHLVGDRLLVNKDGSLARPQLGIAYASKARSLGCTVASAFGLADSC